jgi:hypothetical protein
MSDSKGLPRKICVSGKIKKKLFIFRGCGELMQTGQDFLRAAGLQFCFDMVPGCAFRT